MKITAVMHPSQPLETVPREALAEHSLTAVRGSRVVVDMPAEVALFLAALYRCTVAGDPGDSARFVAESFARSIMESVASNVVFAGHRADVLDTIAEATIRTPFSTPHMRPSFEHPAVKLITNSIAE